MSAKSTLVNPLKLPIAKISCVSYSDILMFLNLELFYKGGGTFSINLVLYLDSNLRREDNFPMLIRFLYFFL